MTVEGHAPRRTVLSLAQLQAALVVSKLFVAPDISVGFSLDATTGPAYANLFL
jgi:hypothetical protein